MPNNQAPGVDWGMIQRRVAAGESYRGIAKDLNEQGIKISHVRISQRARKEGWKTDGKDLNGNPIPPALAHTETARIHAAPARVGHKQIIARGSKTPETAAKILQRILAGNSKTVAAALNGIAPSSLSDWEKQDPELSEMIERAEIASRDPDETALKAAAARGDIRAITMRLQSLKALKSHWGDQGQASSGLTINISLRSEDRLEMPTIDVTPSEVTE